MTKRDAQDMESRTTVYVTFICINYHDFEEAYTKLAHVRINANTDELAMLVKYQNSHPTKGTASGEEFAFFDRLDDFIDGKHIDDHFEHCQTQELMEKPGLHFFYRP